MSFFFFFFSSHRHCIHPPLKSEISHPSQPSSSKIATMGGIKPISALLSLLLASYPSSIISRTIHLRANPVTTPFCTGCGLGYPQSVYASFIDSIDGSEIYNLPFFSTEQGFNFVDPTGDTIARVEVENSDGNGTGDPVTISGQAIKDGLSTLNSHVNSNQGTCFSYDGAYTYGLEIGQVC